MSVTIKSEREIQLMREAGHLLEKVHEELGTYIKPGISTNELYTIDEEIIRSYACTPNFLNYQRFPATF
jgi:methionyl aminopeptidase